MGLQIPKLPCIGKRLIKLVSYLLFFWKKNDDSEDGNKNMVGGAQSRREQLRGNRWSPNQANGSRDIWVSDLLGSITASHFSLLAQEGLQNFPMLVTPLNVRSIKRADNLPSYLVHNFLEEALVRVCSYSRSLTQGASSVPGLDGEDKILDFKLMPKQKETQWL